MGSSQTGGEKRRARDAYANPAARLGAYQNNIAEESIYPITRRTQSFALMNSLYRNDWIAGRIIDTVAEDMCKSWYRITSGIEADRLARFSRIERRTGVKRKVIEGLKWGRLYGGAAGMLLIDGQEDMLDEPLDLRLIVPGQFRGLLLADRWSGVFPSGELVEDLSDPDFGLPEYYHFNLDGARDQASALRVHHSRVLRFVGRELPRVERLVENHWGMSELEHVYEELNKRNSASANIAQLIFQSNLRVLKMSDLGQMLTSTSPAAQEDLYKTIEAQNMMMNSMGIQLMDREDSFETHSFSFAGLSDVYELFMMDIAGAAEIPVTKLFGRSPAGMNATGESDLTNYYDMIHQKQESVLRPVLDKLLPVLCMSALGEIPDDLDYEFVRIRESTDSERAELIDKTASAVLNLYGAGLLSREVALRELRASEGSTGMWHSITDEEIGRA